MPDEYVDRSTGIACLPDCSCAFSKEPAKAPNASYSRMVTMQSFEASKCRYPLFGALRFSE
jgi:hypothetical protein